MKQFSYIIKDEIGLHASCGTARQEAKSIRVQ